MSTSRPLAVIITALPLEREAVLQHLHDVKEEPEHNGSIYRRGIFDERSDAWDVVVAEIGPGNVNAAAEAVRILDHYSPRVAFFVGIAGALKDRKHGDVVASTKVYQYESGKDEKDFKTRPLVQLSDYRLEKRAQHEAGERDWCERIKGDRVSDAKEPVAVVAPIAAGEKVVGSNKSHTYKLIRKHYNDAIAVEMEGHGFLLGVHMNSQTQGIVIRGISDLVDDKDDVNDAKWQPIAARHASAFAFQVLAKLSPPNGNKTRSVVVAAPIQQVAIGDISGDNNTFNFQSDRIPKPGESVQPVTTVGPDAHAEIDAACARMNDGEPDIAIHMLKELKKKRWDTMSSREKYRTIANIGHALERKGEFHEAAKYHIEAKQYQPQDEKARAYEAIAYDYLGDREKAYGLVGDILKEHPNCSIAVAVRIHTAPQDIPLDDLKSIIPPAICNELEIVNALFWKSLALGDLNAAKQFSQTAIEKYPDASEAKEQQSVVNIQQEGRAKQLGKEVDRRRLELAVSHMTSLIKEQRGYRDEARFRYNRGLAYDLLGKPDEAETDFRVACDSDKQDALIGRQFALFLRRHGRLDSAINILRSAVEHEKDPSNCLILSDMLRSRKGKGDIESAISILRDSLSKKPELNVRTDMVGLLTGLLGTQNQHDEAFGFLDSLEKDDLSASTLFAIRARVLFRAGRKEEASNEAILALRALDENSSEAERIRVAESLYFVGQKIESLHQWKGILKPDHIDQSVYLVLDLAKELGDDQFIITFCRQLREAGEFSPHILELEVVTLEKYRMFDTAIKIMNGYLSSSLDGEFSRIFRLRLSLLGLWLERPELVESDPTKLPSVESVSPEIGAAASQVLRSGLHPERGIEYAYELVRLNYNDDFARGSYVVTVGMGEESFRFPEFSVVSLGCAVKYKIDDGGEEKWLIIEDSTKPVAERGEYSPDHIWVKQLIGQSVGSKFYLRSDQIQPRTATITEIVSKYLYRQREIIDTWEERFPEEDKFFIRKYTIPNHPDGSPDISLILKSLDFKEKHNEEMHAIYKNNPLSAAPFATFINTGLVDSLTYIVSEGTLPVRCCLGTLEEREQAELSLVSAKTIVIDPSALATLFLSNQWEQLQLLKGKIVICESALEEYRERRRKTNVQSRGYLGKFKGQYFLTEDNPDDRLQQEQALGRFLTGIKSFVVLKTGESLAGLQREHREELVQLFGHPTAEAIAETIMMDAVLWTDDLVVAEVGRERMGVGKRVWTQVVFKSKASSDAYTDLTLFLIQWRYFFTRLEPEVILAGCRSVSWELDTPLLKQIAEWFKQPELIDQGAWGVCVNSLRLLWQENITSSQKQDVARLLLQAIRSRKNGAQFLWGILNAIELIFAHNQTSCRECKSVIQEMMTQTEMRPATKQSKAAWKKVIPQIQRRIGKSIEINPQQTSQKRAASNTPSNPRDKQKPKRKKRKPK
jgi:nucleoside phosphorylase/tetratricopeptide (TPR) repeat protein